MTTIIISDRTEGMVDASANCYQESKIFKAVQNTQALEYDRLYTDTEEIDLQLSPFTATWGLVYWEISVGIIPNPTGDYELRRPPILAKMLNEQNVGVSTIRELVENYGEEADIVVSPGNYTVTVTFQNGMPPFLSEFKDMLENLVHAHMGVAYKFMYRSPYGTVYVGTRHTLAPSIVVHPYLLGNYQTRSTIRAAVAVKTAFTVTIKERSNEA